MTETDVSGKNEAYQAVPVDVLVAKLEDIRKAVEKSSKKDRLDRVWQIAQVIGVVAIPFVVAFYGGRVNATLKGQEIHAQYVSLAVDVLKENESTPHLRQYAVAVLDSLGPVPMDSVLRNALAEGRVRLPGLSTDDIRDLGSIRDQVIRDLLERR